jgi:hypothetical protein
MFVEVLHQAHLINRLKKVPFIINNNDFLMNGIHQAGSGNTGWGSAR